MPRDLLVEDPRASTIFVSSIGDRLWRRRGGLMTPTTGPPPAKDMVWVPGGGFLMGSEDFYPEERPVHRVEVDGFWIDSHPVTNAEFRRFVKATGHVTLAEQAPEPADYPDADPELLVPGALVFRASSGPVDLRDWRTWWAWVPQASWRHPEGPGSGLHGRERHPVVQVAYADALAYAAWAGKALATEAEWEYAARGGLEAKYCRMEVRAWWSCGAGLLVVVVESAKKPVEVGLGVAPVERRRGLLVAALEGQQASFDLVQVGEVVGR
jgi:formylglycine-generating enzyme required for sulfatase activity